MPTNESTTPEIAGPTIAAKLEKPACRAGKIAEIKASKPLKSNLANPLIIVSITGATD